MRKLKKCNNICDYENYYLNQAGGRSDQILIYKGRPFQRGSGWFSNFAVRYGVPMLKFIGKQALSAGRDVVQDVLQGKDFKSSVKYNLKKRAGESLKEIGDKITQSGSGRKRRKLRSSKNIKTKKSKLYNSRKHSTKVKRRASKSKKKSKIYQDIFSKNVSRNIKK